MMTHEELTALAERLEMQSMSSPWFGTAMAKDWQQAAAALLEQAGEIGRLKVENDLLREDFDALVENRDTLRAERDRLARESERTFEAMLKAQLRMAELNAPEVAYDEDVLGPDIP